jgi:flagellar basal body rod protein FlgC
MPASYAFFMNEFDILQSAAAGMDAQRAALDVAARNVAAAEATPGSAAFVRMVPRFAFDPASEPGDDASPGDEAGDPGMDGDDAGALPVRFLGAAPERGVDVDAITEMVAVLDAQRAYESDASVFDAGKRLAERTIDVGRLQ